MKFCVSTGVGTWTNWSTFKPDRRNRKVEDLLKSVKQAPHSGAGYSSRDALQRYCLLHVVVQGPQSFPGLVDFSVWCTVAELRWVKLAQFSDFGLCRRYMRSTECPSGLQYWFWTNFPAATYQRTANERKPWSPLNWRQLLYKTIFNIVALYFT